MTIKKYQGKTKDEAIENAKKELGNRVVIMNVKEVHPGGLFGVFRKSTYEVTAAVEDEFAPKEMPVRDEPPAEPSLPDIPEIDAFDAAADEDIPIASFSGNAALDAGISPMSGIASAQKGNAARRTAFRSQQPQNTQTQAQPQTRQQPGANALSAEALKSAFREVNDVIGATDRLKPSDVRDFDDRSSIIKQEQVKTEQPGAYQEAPVRKSPEPPKAPAAKPERTVSAPEKPPVRQEEPAEAAAPPKRSSSGVKNSDFIRMLYNILMDHDVDERYVNRIIDEMGDTLHSGNSLDYLLMNVYQKMVLLLGTPKTISIPDKRPLVVFFVGPTGVGKTTTIAKIASKFQVEKRMSVALLTADYYRVAATDQLRVYADILIAPTAAIYSPEDIDSEIANVAGCDLILVDTFGFSHKDPEKKEELKTLLSSLSPEYQKEIYLVLSANTKYKDLREIVDSYREFCDFNIIFTKLDETAVYGNILNTRLYSGKELSYITTGQNVPDDIEEIDMQKLVKLLLGGKSDGSGAAPKKHR